MNTTGSLQLNSAHGIQAADVSDLFPSVGFALSAPAVARPSADSRPDIFHRWYLSGPLVAGWRVVVCRVCLSPSVVFLRRPHSRCLTGAAAVRIGASGLSRCRLAKEWAGMKGRSERAVSWLLVIQTEAERRRREARVKQSMEIQVRSSGWVGMYGIWNYLATQGT